MGFFKDLKEGSKDFGENIAAIVNSVLLTLVYIFGVGATSIFAKLSGKKFLELSKNSESYWVDAPVRTDGMEGYYKQF